MYRNQHDKDGTCAVMGNAAQERFDEVITSMNGTSTPSTTQEDIHSHIDRYVKLDDNEFSVDVKSAKATRRDGSIVIDEVWVELINVQGNNGWLFGKEDFLAFELKKYNFLLVPRLLLAKLCKEKIDTNCIVSRPEDALYKLYSREGRKDMISRIKLDDVINIKHIILRKR